MLLIDFSPLTFKWILQLDKDGPDLGQHLAGDDQAHVLVDDGLDEALEALDQLVLAMSQNIIEDWFIFLTLISGIHSYWGLIV